MLFFKQKKNNQNEALKNALQNPKILEVNLIKGEVKIAFDWNKNISVLLLVLFITGVFIGEIYFGLDWWEKQETIKAQSLDSSISQVNSDISKIKSKADEALAYKDKSVEVSKLIDNHIYWTNFFNWLERNTLSTVKFDSFTGDTSGNYSLNASALSYAEVSWQVKAFLNDPIVKKVDVLTVDSIMSKDKNKPTAQGVGFNLSFELDPKIFKK